MKLHIERLTLESDRRLVPEEVAAAAEAELARLAEAYGLPFAPGRRGVGLPRVKLEITPGASAVDVGSRIARQLMMGWYRESGTLPPDLDAKPQDRQDRHEKPKET